ncbi:amidohydrolase family protein [Actinomycetospora sp. NBRC 106378]|uniref:amidohydrolase family protein n=1 Tax=Actinomycetospora sp. NBRC 106378 TaxID=3032208 RepID=UPI0024A0AD4A|nr:amidohydrolase family protein [Actinomycetospora sp. NBRC 106378]GLZ55311.1 amidohydrolase [Actinomycetospora sp. NBRC 106378]
MELVSGRRVIVDAERPPQEYAAVLVDGGVVVAVGPTAELVAAHPDVNHRAFPDATVLPGLIDAHVHLAFDVTRDPVPALRDADHAALHATIQANAATVLAAGITTVRDLGDRDGLVAAFRDDVAAGVAPGPRVLTAGAPLTPPGGHCWFLGGEVTRDGVRAAVASRAAAGLDVVKVMASGGMMTPAGPGIADTQFDLPTLRLVVEAAREVGLPVAVHAHGTASVAMAARAGADTIEHAGWYAPGGGRDLDDAVAELVAVSGAVTVPTRFRGWPEWPEPEREAALARQRWADGHGIPVLVGNDAGAGQGRFDDLYDALTWYVEVGWTPAQVLAATTCRSADALGLGDVTGRLRPGLAADLIVVDGDPLADIGAVRRLRLVCRPGSWR